MVGALAMVLFAANWAANPANWYWIAPPGAADAAPSSVTRSGADGGETPDFTVREDAPLKPGTVRVARTVPQSGDETAGDDAADGDAAGANEPDANGPDADGFEADGRLPSALTAVARDRTVGGMNRAERDAVAEILARLQRRPPTIAADTAAVSFNGMIGDADYYRGRPVRVFGRAARILDAPDGRGVDLWIYAPDAGPNPIHVRANRADDLPRGRLLKDGVPVTADGVFFKLEAYAAATKDGEGLHVSPLVLADTVRGVTIAPAVPQTPKSLPWVALGVIAAAAAGGAALVWRWKRADRAYEQTTLNRLSAAADAEGESLQFAADDAGPEAFLAGLADGSPAPATVPHAEAATTDDSAAATEPAADTR